MPLKLRGRSDGKAKPADVSDADKGGNAYSGIRSCFRSKAPLTVCFAARTYLALIDDTESWRTGPDRVRDIRGGKVSVMLFHHPRVGVSQVFASTRSGIPFITASDA